MSKVDEFKRINEPRVQRALDQIALVENSAKSMRLSEEGIKLIQRVVDYLGVTGAPVMPAPPVVEARKAQPKPGPIVEVTEPVACKLDCYADLPTTDLIDIALACAVEIAKRRG